MKLTQHLSADRVGGLILGDVRRRDCLWLLGDGPAGFAEDPAGYRARSGARVCSAPGLLSSG